MLKQHLPKASASAAALGARLSNPARSERRPTPPTPTPTAESTGRSPPTRCSPRTSGAPPCPTRARAPTDSGWPSSPRPRNGSVVAPRACTCTISTRSSSTRASRRRGHAAWPPVAAVALSAGGLLALATRDNAVLSYDVESARLSPWSEALAAAETATPAELAAMPGQICGLSFDPTPGSSALLAHTPSAIARINLAATPAVGTRSRAPLRRRRGEGRGGGWGGAETSRGGGRTTSRW